jgi:D-alanine transaminase
VLEVAHAQGLPVDEAPVLVTRFREAEEVFLVGTPAEVLPVVTLDGARVGSGRPGPVAAGLLRGRRALA